jgi:hypothetical protein
VLTRRTGRDIPEDGILHNTVMETSNLTNVGVFERGFSVPALYITRLKARDDNLILRAL